MMALRRRFITLREDERGFTMSETLTTVAIAGIVLAIAVILLLGLLERRKVDAATRQLAADLRLAHTSAANQLTDWRVVLVPGRGDEGEGPDYYLVRLAAPYNDEYAGSPVWDSTVPVRPRYLPANVEVMTRTNKNGAAIQDNQARKYYLSPDAAIAGRPTRTLEFNSDGAMTGYGGSPSGTVGVTIDGDPQGQVRYLAATSLIKILP